MNIPDMRIVCLHCSKSEAIFFPAARQESGEWKPINAQRPANWIGGPAEPNDIQKGICPVCIPYWRQLQDKFIGPKFRKEQPARVVRDPRPIKAPNIVPIMPTMRSPEIMLRTKNAIQAGAAAPPVPPSSSVVGAVPRASITVRPAATVSATRTVINTAPLGPRSQPVRILPSAPSSVPLVGQIGLGKAGVPMATPIQQNLMVAAAPRSSGIVSTSAPVPLAAAGMGHMLPSATGSSGVVTISAPVPIEPRAANA